MKAKNRKDNKIKTIKDFFKPVNSNKSVEIEVVDVSDEQSLTDEETEPETESGSENEDNENQTNEVEILEDDDDNKAKFEEPDLNESGRVLRRSTRIVAKRKIQDDDEEEEEEEEELKSKSKKATSKIKKSSEPKKVKLKSQKSAKLAKSFLYSGLPDEIIKKQKTFDKKKEEDDFLNVVHFFPKLSHTNFEFQEQNNNTAFTHKICNKIDDNFEELDYTDINSYFLKTKKKTLDEETTREENTIFCCKRWNEFPLKAFSLNSKNSLPWIEKYKIESRKDIVVDYESYKIIEKWLKQWKRDIKSDGGLGRKFVVKRKKGRNSDSDFVASDDEDLGDESLKNKSVILCGSSGTGKSAAVYYLAEKHKFKVVELNFSSKRSGKDILTQVEEATLSQQLESKKNCLILIKDVDLQDKDADEGFGAAIAQLITSSCRPIVMTMTSKLLYMQIDSKIEKKEPLWVYFKKQPISSIIEKALNPILAKEQKDKEIDEMESLNIETIIHSVARHSGNDVRRCINQLQFTLAGNPYVLKAHNSLCLDLDINYISSDRERKHLRLKSPNELCPESKINSILKNIVQNISLLTDFDIFLNNQSCVFNDDLYQFDELKSNLSSNFIRGINLDKNFGDSKQKLEFYNSFVFDNEKDNSKKHKITEMNEKLEEYFESSDFECLSFVRSIIKSNKISTLSTDSIRNRRNGRVFSYRQLSHEVLEDVCQTFDFETLYKEATVLNFFFK